MARGGGSFLTGFIMTGLSVLAVIWLYNYFSKDGIGTLGKKPAV